MKLTPRSSRSTSTNTPTLRSHFHCASLCYPSSRERKSIGNSVSSADSIGEVVRCTGRTKYSYSELVTGSSDRMLFEFQGMCTTRITIKKIPSSSSSSTTATGRRNKVRCRGRDLSVPMAWRAFVFEYVPTSIQVPPYSRLSPQPRVFHQVKIPT